jgi:hypothetical protein
VTTEVPSEEGTESGGALREKLEAEIAEKKVLRETLATEVAERFQYVRPEDLQDVAPGELRERAAQIEEQRAAERRDVLSAELAAKGWTDTQIEEFLGEKPQSAPPQQTPKPRFDGNVGTPPARPKPGEGDDLFGPSRIRAALGS